MYSYVGLTTLKASREGEVPLMSMCPECVTTIKKLAPGEGDILVLRLSDIPPPEQVERFGAGLKAEGIKGYILVIDDESDVYVLSEEMMATIGWVRKR